MTGQSIVEEAILYDRIGRAVAYVLGSSHIYAFSGRPLAYIKDNEMVYSFAGTFLGWFQDGWLRDLRNRSVSFVQEAKSGPTRPPWLHTRLTKMTRHICPPKGTPESPSRQPSPSMIWSGLAFSDFLDQ